MVPRTLRLNALLHQEIAASFYKVFAGGGLDLAAVSVTHVEVAPNLRNCTVRVSILGHEKERGGILATLNRHAPDFQKLINRDCHMKYTPRLRFEYDPSIERGGRVLDALLHLPPPADT
ncbi:MAG: ribosome-binding factor A [Kiritimatiellaeota bacterium]|nr:ribosome-binding factor A [Kiritimatiellota bacterium]